MSESKNAATASSAPRRGPLWLRILLGLAVAVALGVVVICAVNIRAVTTYNQATQSLQSNLAAAKKTNVDLDSLALRQQQTDAEYDDASRWTELQLPGVRSSIEANASLSRTLTSRINSAIDAQNASGQSQQGQTSNGTQSGSQTGQGSDSDGLTEEQRNKINELLKANQQRSSSGSTHSQSSTAGSSSSPSNKPW